MKAGKKKKWNRYMAVILAVLCLFGVNMISVQAATTTKECFGIVLQFDSEGETVDASTAIVVQLDGTLAAFTKVMDGNAEGTVGILTTGTENTYLLQYGDVITVGNYDLSLWGLDESDEAYQSAFSDSAFLETADPHQNEAAVAVYLGSESGEIESTAMMLLECDENGILTVDQYPSSARYPAALVNAEGKLVGMCLQDNVIWAIRNGAEFYGNSQADEPSTGKAPPLPPREDPQPTVTPETEEPSETQKNTEASSAAETVSPVLPNDTVKEYKSSSKTMTIVVVVAVVIAAAVVVFVLAGKKKKQGSITSQIETPVAGPEIALTPHTIPVDYPKPDEVFPVQGKSAEAPKLWLAARGGCMNGRVYPVEKTEISIGRDASSTIRYPADTAGVSRVHAKLYWQGGQLMLMDCNSTSGTFLQRQGKLTPMTPVEVRSGDVFYVGEKINSFEIKD